MTFLGRISPSMETQYFVISHSMNTMLTLSLQWEITITRYHLYQWNNSIYIVSPIRRQAIIWTNASIYIVNWTLGIKFQWHFICDSKVFIKENVFENVSKMAVILSRHQCVKMCRLKFGWYCKQIYSPYWFEIGQHRDIYVRTGVKLVWFPPRSGMLTLPMRDGIFRLCVGQYHMPDDALAHKVARSSAGMVLAG